jgi:DNA-binding FadR family transcriptional regulator
MKPTAGCRPTPGHALPGLYSSVLDALGVRLVTGQLPTGEVLTMQSISAEYDVSLPVAREAIRVLQSMGMVASRRRVGVTVLTRADWHALDRRLIRWRLGSPDRNAQMTSLAELLRSLEPVAAGLAATRATPVQCSALASAASDMVVQGGAGDPQRCLEAAAVFHATLLAASGNEMLQGMASVFAEVFAEVLAGRTHHGLMSRAPDPHVIDLHDAVARAIRIRDPGVAETAMRHVIDAAAADRVESGS